MSTVLVADFGRDGDDGRTVAAEVVIVARVVGFLVLVVALVAGLVPAAQARHSAHARRPVPGAVVRAFDPPATPYGPGHRGVDLAAEPGDVVRAALPGRVSFAGEVAGMGYVTVNHGAGLETTYGDLDPRLVVAGRQVSAGTVLGRLADDATHLDWGARLNGGYIDPITLLGTFEIRLIRLPRS